MPLTCGKKYKQWFQVLHPVYFLLRILRHLANYLWVIFLLLYLCYLHKASFLENESYRIQTILVGLSGTCDFKTRLNKASTGLLGLTPLKLPV